MVYRSRSADWGGFSKGFAEAFAAMMKLAEDKRHNEAVEAHWARMDQNARTNNPWANGVFSGVHGGFKEGYNDGAGGGTYNAPTGDASTRAGEYSKFLQDQGYSKAGAAAILGNWWQENNLNGGGFGGDNGTSAGGFQWHDNPSKGLYRGTGFMNWAKENNLDVNDPMTSLKYLVHDLNTDKQWSQLNSDLKSTDDVDQATAGFTRIYEAPNPAKANMPNRLGFARTVYGSKPAEKGKEAEPTVDGKPAVTTIVSPEKEGENPKAEPAKTSQADTLPTNQLAGGTDEEAMRIAVEENRRLLDQQNADSPAPPPGSAMPRNERSLPPLPRPGAGPISAIEPTVPAQSTPFDVPPESGFPTPPPWRETDQPALPPVQGRETGPENVGRRPWQESDQPRLPPVPGQGPVDPSIIARQRGIPPTPIRPQYGPPMPPVGNDQGTPSLGGGLGSPVDTTSSGGRTGPAEVNVPLASGERDERTTPDSAKPSESSRPVSATKPTPQSRQDNSRFVLVDRPNADPIRRGTEGAPRSTALNLSSLWGPNPPISQRGQAAAASAPAAAAPSRHDDDNTVPPAPDDTNTAGITDEMIMGSRKGGPIRGYARGGAIPTQPTMRYAGGGAAGPGTFGSGSGSVPSIPYVNQTSAVPGYTYNPGVSSGENLRLEQNQALYGTPNPSPTQYNTYSDSFNALTPAQQQWYIQSAVAGNYNQANANPYPATPKPTAATPAATPAVATPKVVNPTVSTTVTPVTDTTTTDPSTTTGTGIPSVPTSGAIAKSYDPNVDAKTGAGFSNTQSAGGTNYSVGADDLLKKNDQGTISGYARGGGIPTRPTMRYAAGGATAAPTAPTTAMLADPAWQNTRSTYTTGPNTTPLTNQEVYTLQQTVNAKPSGQPFMGSFSDWLAGDMNARNPAGASRDLTKYYGAYTAPAATPAATPTTPVSPTVTTTVTPVTDTTTTDPSTVAGAGTPGVPDTPTVNPAVDPATPVVNPDVTTVVGTPTNPVPNAPRSYDPTADTTGSNSGSRDTGSTNYGLDPTASNNFGYSNYNQIQGFDDGGVVNPSALGMPPGLSGGSSPPPPIYYNGATYSPAGAPVGKGVTQSSVPTYIAGAIPSLPMMRGGIVKRYADGGDVDEYTGEDVSDRPNEDVTQGGRSGQPNEFTGDYPSTTPAVSAPLSQPPANLPAWMPQVEDGQGNPSRGLIGAIAGGLHYIASQLGVTGDGQQQGAIANDPSVQANRQSFAQGEGLPGAPMPTHQEVSAIHQSLGLNDGLHEGLANLAGMEAVRNFYLIHGDPQKADQMAASMLQYSVTLSRDYGDQAVKRYYANDLNGSVHALLKAKESIADGTLMNAKVNNDANGNPVSVNIEGTDLSGKPLWAKTVGPEAILGAALHTRNGSLAWSLYEIQAARYDPHTADMIKQRQARTQQEAANEQIAGFGPTSTPYEGGGGGGGGAQPPQITPVNVPPAPQPVNRGIPLAPGQTEAGSPPVIGALAPPLPSIGQSGLEASRAQPPSPEQQVVMEGNRGRGPDTTSAQSAAPPPEPAPEPPAQVAQQAPPQAPGFRPALPGPGAPPEATLGVGAPTRENASNIPAENAQEVAALSPEAEQARYQQIEQTIHAQYRDPKTGGIVLDGQLYQMPQPISQATNAKMAPEVRTAWNQRMEIFRWASTEAAKRAASEIDAQRRDYGVSLASQRSGAQMRQQSAMEDRREQAKIDAAALQERNKQADAIKLAEKQQQLKAFGDEYNYAMANSKPLSPEDTEKRVTIAGGIFAPLAQASLPDFKLDPNSKTPEDDARVALGNAKIDEGTQRDLGNAYKSGLQYSTHSSEMEVAQGVMALANGAHTKQAKYEPRDDSFHIVVPLDNGSVARLTLPSDVAENLRTIGLKAAQAKEAARVAGVNQLGESQSWPTPPAPAGGALPGPPDTRSVPADFWHGSRQPVAPGPALRLPERVPSAQVPPEWREQFPELNQ